MNADRRSSHDRVRSVLIISAVAGLSVLVLFHVGARIPEPTSRLAHAVPPVERPSSDRSKVVPLDGPTVGRSNHETRQPAPSAYERTLPPSRQPQPPRFKFLGRIAEGDDSVVLLFSGGKTLPVRDIGPLDDDYVVDAIGDAYLVLRHVSSGETQIIQLVARESPVNTGWSAENTPQD